MNRWLIRRPAAELGVKVRALDYKIWEHQSGPMGAPDSGTRTDYLRKIATRSSRRPSPDSKRPVSSRRSRYQVDQYLHVGRDYQGGDVMGAEASALEEALKTLYPDRFDEPLRRPEPEFPGGYIHRFLEAAIVRCARLDKYDPYGAPAVETIEELIAVLEADEATVYACRAMSNMTAEGHEPIVIGDVTVYPETERFGGLVRQAVTLIPAGPGAFNREDPRPHDPPHALIVATARLERGKAAWNAQATAIRDARPVRLRRKASKDGNAAVHVGSSRGPRRWFRKPLRAIGCSMAPGCRTCG